MTRAWFVLVVLALAAAGAGGFWWWRHRTPPPIQWQGYADADFVKVGPRLEGLLVSVKVVRGDKVARGVALFDQDEAADRASLEQAQRQLGQAEAQLANLEAPGKPTEILEAEANLADAQAARDKVQQDLERNQKLLPSGVASVQTVGQQQADLRSANAKVQAMEAALAQARAPMGRETEITAQQAAVDAARSAVAMAQWRVDQRHVTSPAGGVIADVLARPGEMIPAGTPVVSLLPPENVFVRFFVPEPNLSQVHYGDQVALGCDGCSADFEGTIAFIAPQAEYTPPVIYSDTTTSKLVYMVEARPPPDQASLINPGQPIVVRPITKEAGR
jgi:HlyD family secretion protein